MTTTYYRPPRDDVVVERPRQKVVTVVPARPEPKLLLKITYEQTTVTWGPRPSRRRRRRRNTELDLWIAALRYLAR
jgi:hypothetical protein